MCVNTGGSLAQVAALDLALDPDLALQSEQIVCYAIAAPRVGTHAFAKAYEVAVPHTWNIINDQVNHSNICHGLKAAVVQKFSGRPFNLQCHIVLQIVLFNLAVTLLYHELLAGATSFICPAGRDPSQCKVLRVQAPRPTGGAQLPRRVAGAAGGPGEPPSPARLR